MCVNEADTVGLGLGSGLLNVAGLGAFVNTTSDSPLEKAREKLEETQKLWGEKVQEWQEKVSAEDRKKLEAWIISMNEATNSTIQVLQFRQDKDDVLIATLYVLVLVLVLFLLFLPEHAVSSQP